MLTRREFCGALASTALAASAGRCLAASSTYKLRYIVSAAMYGKYPLDQVIAEVPKTGARHIDLWPLPHGNHREQMTEMGVDAVASLLKKHNVQLGCITRYDLGPFGLTEEMAIVQKLGGEVIVCGAKGAPKEAKDAAGSAVKPLVADYVEKLKPVGELAAKHSLVIAIENHVGSMLSSVDSMRYFAELNKSPQIGIAFAPHHLPQDGVMQGKLIEELGPAVKFYYAQQHGKGTKTTLPKEEELLQMPGRGPLDFAPAVAALKKLNYQGFFEIFMHPYPRGLPIVEGVENVTAEINRSRAHIEKLLAAV